MFIYIYIYGHLRSRERADKTKTMSVQPKPSPCTAWRPLPCPEKPGRAADSGLPRSTRNEEKVAPRGQGAEDGSRRRAGPPNRGRQGVPEWTREQAESHAKFDTEPLITEPTVMGPRKSAMHSPRQWGRPDKNKRRAKDSTESKPPTPTNRRTTKQPTPTETHAAKHNANTTTHVIVSKGRFFSSLFAVPLVRQPPNE